LLDVRLGNGDDRLEEVVKDDHAIVEAETEVGQVAVVGWRIRQALDVADGVITGVADTAAEETRQAMQRRRAVNRQFFLQEQQRGGVLQLDDLVTLLHLDMRAGRLEAQERPRAEETVASQPLAPDDALEQERPVALLNLAEGADRRQRVAGQLAVDRHQVALAGQSNELIERRVGANHNLTPPAPPQSCPAPPERPAPRPVSARPRP